MHVKCLTEGLSRCKDQLMLAIIKISSILVHREGGSAKGRQAWFFLTSLGTRKQFWGPLLLPSFEGVFRAQRGA